jgi:hypothetical protein
MLTAISTQWERDNLPPDFFQTPMDMNDAIATIRYASEYPCSAEPEKEEKQRFAPGYQRGRNRIPEAPKAETPARIPQNASKATPAGEKSVRGSLR